MTAALSKQKFPWVTIVVYISFALISIGLQVKAISEVNLRKEIVDDLHKQLEELQLNLNCPEGYERETIQQPEQNWYICVERK